MTSSTTSREKPASLENSEIQLGGQSVPSRQGISSPTAQIRQRNFRTVLTICLVSLFGCQLVWGQATGESSGESSGESESQGVSQAEWKRGFHGFAMLCRAEGISVETDPQLLYRSEQDDLIVVIFGGAPGLAVNLQGIVNRGGAVLVAADDGQTMSGLTNQLGIRFHGGPVNVTDEKMTYQRYYPDCFRISALDASHPITKDVREVVANRAGVLSITRRARFFDAYDRWRPLAKTPPARAPRYLQNQVFKFDFMAALQSRDGGRGLAVADHSVFTNQMLACGDNARLAAQTVVWLADNKRTKVIFLVDRSIVSPADPTLVDITIPPPTPQQVRDALANLPPDEFREVVNTVATVVEDEGILNDVFGEFFRRLPRHLYNRFIILAASLTLAFFAILRAVSFRGTLEIDANGDEVPGARSQRIVDRVERHHVAMQMLDRFRVDVTGSAKTSWDDFVKRVRIVGNPIEATHLRRELVSYRGRKPNYWNAHRLEELKSQLDHWRHLLQSGALEYDRS
jgi:hypothetical protein